MGGEEKMERNALAEKRTAVEEEDWKQGNKGKGHSSSVYRQNRQTVLETDGEWGGGKKKGRKARKEETGEEAIKRMTVEVEKETDREMSVRSGAPVVSNTKKKFNK